MLRTLALLCALFAVGAAQAKPVNAPMFVDEADGRNWPSYGRTYNDDHYSPLTQINDGNIGRLKLAWFIDLPTVLSAYGQPLVVNGVMYFAIGHSLVYAADAATGKVLWTYDPKVTEATNDKLKQAWGIRGLAYADNRVFVGAQDGRLLALNAKSGKQLWSVNTTEPDDGRYVTGAPRVFNGKVIIGHGGADHSPVRGYATAYDAATGKQLWRFFTVPGDPAKGFESKAQEMAAKTWTGEWWKLGGGGTVWHAITYDPKYNRIYLGTGNGSPWNRNVRSPGGGDNLFLCAIVALDADTGEYVWHYQTTPGESWDYNSNMDILLAEIAIDGKPRDVIMHAPKNGFFYVIDRADGKLISAEAFAPVTWAKYVDKATGRPVENPEARFPTGETTIVPGPIGAHSAAAMSYSPVTKLAYIPVIFTQGYYNAKGVDAKTWAHTKRPAVNNGFTAIYAPDMEATMDQLGTEPMSELQARDPITQKVAWRSPSRALHDGGILSTGGNLVFQGRADGAFQARAADTGKLLWSADAQNGVASNPITYVAGGKQYVAVLAAYGGGAGLTGHAAAQFGWDYRTQQRRMLVYVLDGGATLPPRPKLAPQEIVDDPAPIEATLRDEGRMPFMRYCVSCHGPGVVAGGTAPDLRMSTIPLSSEAFQDVVRGGALRSQSMPQFDDLTPQQVEAMRHYIRGEARRATDKLRAKAVR